MTQDEQLNAWVEGDSLHDHEREQCCPDFSCCQTHYKASDDERRTFRDRPELRDAMLIGFLGAALANCGKTVHVAGSIQGNA